MMTLRSLLSTSRLAATGNPLGETTIGFSNRTIPGFRSTTFPSIFEKLKNNLVLWFEFDLFFKLNENVK